MPPRPALALPLFAALLPAACAAPLSQGPAAPHPAQPPAETAPHAPAVAPAAAPPAPAQAFCSPEFQAGFGWPDPAKAARVCRCESSGNPRAMSRSGKYLGLFQLSASAFQRDGAGDPFDPYVNSASALRLFLRKGWKPWPHCGRN